MKTRRTTPARAVALCLTAAALVGCSEPLITYDGAVVAGINAAAAPLGSVVPIAARADLVPFTGMMGTARLIGLGEATHGSHEFFTMKDRLFRHLVEDDGVTGFAIEATMPEAFALDTYVRTGVGDPAVLLSHLYFWTWNTQEVANLIAWLRQWNQEHPSQQVGFYGFDMQYPGVAIDSVVSYVGRAAPDLSAMILDHYACLDEYRNNTRGIFQKKYSNATTGFRTDCAFRMTAARNLLQANHDTLVAASSERDYQLAFQMTRLILQWEAMASTASGAAVRDQMMAENIGWLLNREGPGGRLVLWAHDYHIGRFPGSMGSRLNQAFGNDYVPVGFAFGSGGLNAVEGFRPNVYGSLKAFDAPAPLIESYEALLSQADAPNFYLDLRQVSGPAGAWLANPRAFRAIGSVYFASTPEVHYGTLQVTSLYDILIFIRTTTPSQLLPFKY